MIENPYETPKSVVDKRLPISGQFRRFLVVSGSIAIATTVVFLLGFVAFGIELDREVLIGLAIIVTPLSALFGTVSYFFVRAPIWVIALVLTAATVTATFGVVISFAE
jgi:hypothetical protein